MDSDIQTLLNQGSALNSAIRLIGSDLERVVDGHILRARIVETEAYDESDRSSHSYHGMTNRNSVMFGPSGTAYVYFTYGLHYCFNVVVGEVGEGSAVLIRALEPIVGEEIMMQNRQTENRFNLLSGPAKLCQALAIDKTLNGHNLACEPLRLILKSPLIKNKIGFSERIGINEPKNNILLWRVFLKSSNYLSRRKKV